MARETAVPIPASGVVRLRAIRTRVDALADQVFAFWKTKGPDRVNGGFFGTLDRMGTPTTPTDKGLIQQARHLWTFANWYELRGKNPEAQEIANHLYKFLPFFYDSASRQYVWKVSEKGIVSSIEANRVKVLYVQGFAIYALATYGRVFQVAQAKAQALETYRAIDARHDAVNTGYNENNDWGFNALGAPKSTNTHIHLMEAFTALYQATGDTGVRARLEELVTVVTDKIFQPNPGYCHLQFGDNWQTKGQPSVSYGHDLETAWLLLDAARALGRPDDAKIVTTALAMGTHAAEWGFDMIGGGYFEDGSPGGQVTSKKKIWWAQAEALPALLSFYQLTQDSRHLDKLEKTLTWIEQRQRDTPETEWFWGIEPDGTLDKSHGTNKGEEWKASYHNSRALTLTSLWITGLVGS